MNEIQISMQFGCSLSGRPRRRNKPGDRKFQTPELFLCTASSFIASRLANCIFQEGPCQDVVAAS